MEERVLRPQVIVSHILLARKPCLAPGWASSQDMRRRGKVAWCSEPATTQPYVRRIKWPRRPMRGGAGSAALVHLDCCTCGRGPCSRLIIALANQQSRKPSNLIFDGFPICNPPSIFNLFS